MHACHIPLRLGWKPQRLFAQLQKGFAERPDGKGGMAACDTWDNALLNCWTTIGTDEVPLRLEMKLNTFLKNFGRARQFLLKCLRGQGVDLSFQSEAEG